MGTKEKEVNFQSTADLTINAGFKSTISIPSAEISSSGEKCYNPFEHRHLEKPNSTVGSALHLLKSCLGSGILAMPSAFKNAGLLVGSIGTLIAGVVCTIAVHVLVQVSRELCVETRTPSMSYAETCGAAFRQGPKKLRPWADWFQEFVDYSMALTYASTLCVYVVFIGSTCEGVINPYLADSELSIQIYCACTLIPLILICQIRNLKYLVPCSAIANVLIAIVFAITLYYLFNGLPSVKEREMVASVSTWPLFLSTVIFALEGIGVIMPIENEMKHPQHFLGCPGVLNVSMVIVISLYAVVGFFGYLKYGEDALGSITLNLPSEDIVAQSAKLLMGVVIFLTYPLQFYVFMEVVTRKLQGKISPRFNNTVQISIRSVVVAMTVGIAIAFPDLELVINLVGAIFLSTLGLFFPALVETVHRWNRGLGFLNYVLFRNILIMGISLIALVSGTYVSVTNIIESSSKSVIGEVHTNLTEEFY